MTRAALALVLLAGACDVDRMPGDPTAPVVCRAGTEAVVRPGPGGGTESLCLDASGKPDGPYRAFHANGTRAIEGWYLAGQQTGTWRLWDDQGQSTGAANRSLHPSETNTSLGATGMVGVWTMVAAAVGSLLFCLGLVAYHEHYDPS